MKILITGATGLIGKKLKKILSNDNFQINYLTTDKNKIIKNNKIEGFYWNPKLGIIDTNCFFEVDTIVHLAGATIAKRWTKAYKKEILDSRIDSLNLIYESLKNTSNNVEHLISASGTAIYPDSFDVKYTEKNTEIATGFLSEIVIKWEACTNQFKTLGLKVCCVRTGIVYDKNEGALSKIIMPIQLGIGSSFGSGKQIQSWIHGDDVANLYYFLIQNKSEGIYNAVAPEPVSDSILTKTIAKILKKPLFMPNIPRFIMQFILGDMCELLFTNKNILPQKAIDEGFKFQFPKVENALNNILKP